MIHAILSQLSTAVSAGDGSAPFMPRMRAGTLASSNRATKAARLKDVVEGQSLLKGLHDRRKTGQTRSSGKNRHQEILRKRRSHIEGSCSCCSISEGSLVRSPLGC